MTSQWTEWVSLSLDFGFGHVTCFSQWDVSPCDPSWGLKCACAIGVPPCPHGPQKEIHGAIPDWSEAQSQAQLNPDLIIKPRPPHWSYTSCTDTAYHHVLVHDTLGNASRIN